MKKKHLILTLVFSVVFLQAQNNAMNWYFGQNAGLNFSSGTPVAITDSAMAASEGCATISDFNGDLLFYTDGSTIWNKNHFPMSNGTGLMGHSSSTQSAIIVPYPNDLTKYYVFTVNHEGSPEGFQYNLVDLTLDGGLGAVTTKNQLLLTPVVEKLTAVLHANGTDVWVIIHGVNNGFYAYLVTSAGLNTTPVVSAEGTIHAGGLGDYTGYMKASPNGEFLALVTGGVLNRVELFHFNTASGIISDGLNLESYYAPPALPFYRADSRYGLEFSSDSSKLYIGRHIYVTASTSQSSITQFNISTYNQAAIIATGYDLMPLQPIAVAALQLAVDGKIYISTWGEYYLSVINNPNVQGAGSNYVNNAISLAGQYSTFGLPTFIQSYFIVGLLANNFCLGDTTEFTVNSSDPIVSILWDFGDGNTSALETPGHVYATAGTYTVSVTVNTASETKSETKDITIYNVPTAQAIGPILGCVTQDSYNLDLPSFSTDILGAQNPNDFTVAYFLSQLDADNNANPLESIHPFDFGTTPVYVRVSNNSNVECYATSQFDVVARQAPIVATITNWTVCDDDTDGQYTFDLSLKNDEIFNGQNETKFEMLYFASQADADTSTNPLPLSYTNITPVEELFVRFQNSTYPSCYRTGSFTIEVIDGVQANTPTDIQVCDTNNDGFYSFDLATLESDIIGTQNVSSVVVSFHNSQLNADNDTNPLNATSYTNTISYQETIYVRVENSANSDCYATTFFDVIVYDTPIQQTVTAWQVCDDDNDGVFTFDLPEKDTEILGNQSATDYTVTYYESEADAQVNLNAITGNYQNIQNSQQVYYRIANNANAACYITNSFSLEVFNVPTATTPTPIIICDVDETGSYIVNLTEKDSEILNGQDPNTYFVTYYISELDALTSTDLLTAATYNNTNLQETLYARVEHSILQTCYDVTSLELIINPLPQPNLETQYVICPDSPDLVINGGNFESWLWKDSQETEISTDQNLQVLELGTYSLTVTQTTNGVTCENTAAFEVVSSGAPDTFTVDISSFSDEITLAINAIGVGTFEYSINGENYQRNNEFSVFPGEYTVYVRDLYECRTLTEEIIALGYQKFFTPNGDGVHEDWHVIGVNSFPESRIFIYNRYGKLMAQLAPNGAGWDGMYLGKPVPSSDYWFRYEYDNGKIFAGHFALKR